jgi:glycosyltransferase involved in cell wall biosynthesis
MGKTLVLYLNGLNHPGGMERVVSNLLHYWVKDYHIVLLTKDDGNSYYPLPEGIAHISLSSPMIMNMGSRVKRVKAVIISLIKIVLKLRKALNKIEYDYIYVTSPLNAFEVYLASKKVAKNKMVISEHASIYAFNKFYMKMKHVVYPKSYCISVPNSMDTPVYQTWGCNAVFIPHLLTFSVNNDISQKEKIVLNVGRLTPDKQQDKLLAMWAKIENKNNWVLWIVGNGEDKQKLEKYIAENKLNNSVKLLPAQKDIQSIYRKASLFAFVSRCEGFGMVLLEAMAFGVPCISYDCPSGPRDVVSSGKNGYLIENDNDSEYLAKLQYLLTMSDVEYEKLRQGAFDTIKMWNNQEIINKWKEIYK